MLKAVRTVLTGAVCAVVALTGCSVSVEPSEPADSSVVESAPAGSSTDESDRMITKATLEQGIADALEKEVGQRPDSVTCPGSVRAKAGESIRCELSSGPARYGLTATVSSYDNGKASYKIKVDDQPAGQ